MGLWGSETSMTRAARQVLSDCHLALEMMEIESDPDRLRVQWIGALALVRLVGDALSKIDSVDQPDLAQLIERHWNLLRSSKEVIFWEFIKGARDRAVHLYDVDIYESEVVDIAIELPDGTMHYDKLDDCMFMPLQNGFGKGEDARDIYRDALNWWDSQLTGIEGGRN
jgi:hypothetical protein